MILQISKKKFFTIALLCTFCNFVICSIESSSEKKLPNKRTLIIDDFDAGITQNLLGGEFGAWEKDSKDKTQYCKMSFSKEERIGDDGYSLKLEYDVDSPNPAYNGFWMKLNGADFTEYENLVLYAKAGKEGCSDKIKLELKNNKGEVGKYLLMNIYNTWQRFEIPFSKFEDISDFSEMKEFVVVFDDVNSNPKVGVLYIDNISVEGSSAKKTLKVDEGLSKQKELIQKALKDSVEVKETQRGLEINLMQSVNFVSGSTQLIKDSYKTLQQIVNVLKTYPKNKLAVEGHTDNVPISKNLQKVFPTNYDLSKSRAEVVAKYLIENGIDEKRIVSKTGFGPDKPIADNKTPEGKLKNRRVEIIILKEEVQ